jgi:hypothetical protein
MRVICFRVCFRPNVVVALWATGKAATTKPLGKNKLLTRNDTIADVSHGLTSSNHHGWGLSATQRRKTANE